LSRALLNENKKQSDVLDVSYIGLKTQFSTILDLWLTSTLPKLVQRETDAIEQTLLVLYVLATEVSDSGRTGLFL